MAITASYSTGWSPQMSCLFQPKSKTCGQIFSWWYFYIGYSGTQMCMSRSKSRLTLLLSLFELSWDGNCGLMGPIFVDRFQNLRFHSVSCKLEYKRYRWLSLPMNTALTPFRIKARVSIMMLTVSIRLSLQYFLAGHMEHGQLLHIAPLI